MNATPPPIILLVDDEPAVRHMLVDLLAGHGYNVLQAADGEAALELAAVAPRIDLLITDLRLPGVDGVSLAERLRTARPELRVIYMSGFAEDVLTKPERLGPGSCVLEKPFRMARLIELLEHLFNQDSQPRGA